MGFFSKIKKAAKKADKKLGVQKAVRKAVKAASKGTPFENIATAATKVKASDPGGSISGLVKAAQKDAPGLIAAYATGGASALGGMVMDGALKGKASLEADARAKLDKAQAMLTGVPGKTSRGGAGGESADLETAKAIVSGKAVVRVRVRRKPRYLR